MTRFEELLDAKLDEIAHDLVLSGQPPAAEEVRRIDLDWVHQQASVRQSLGQPAPTPSAPPPARG